MNDKIVNKIKQWVRPEVQALSAYHVPDPGECIKLDAMENPYTWPSELLDAWLEVLRSAPLNRYPDPSAKDLCAALRGAMDVPADMDVLLGNGSDELIQMLALAVAQPGRVILAPEPSFVMYRMIALFAGMEYVGVPLREADFSLDMPAMLEAIETHQPALIFLAYPNNPTGNLFSEADVRAVIEAAPGMVVVDEAYAAFASHSFMSLLGEYDNLLVMRTVSKMGLAGLRLGLLAGPPEWMVEIDKVRLPYNINVLTQASGTFALAHQDVLDEQTEQIKVDRKILLDGLRNLPDVTPFDSEANFILVRVPHGRAVELFSGLRDKGVLIKNLHGANAQLSDCVRVTVGTPEENAVFLEALATLL